MSDVLDWQYGLEPAHFVMERKTFSASSSVRRASPASRRIFGRSIKEANGFRLLSAEPFGLVLGKDEKSKPIGMIQRRTRTTTLDAAPNLGAMVAGADILY